MESLSGVIEHGWRRGTNILKIPTANLKWNRKKKIPKIGVYAGLVVIESSMYGAMINIGSNPTFENTEVTIEAHILDFDKDIYGKKALFIFVEMIREEIKFNSIDALKNQLISDIEESYKSLRKHKEEIFEFISSENINLNEVYF